MSDYDVLYGVVIRLPGGNGINLIKNIDEITQRLGKAIQTEFPDVYAIPFGFEVVESDGKVRIINKVEYPIELEDEEYPEEEELMNDGSIR